MAGALGFRPAAEAKKFFFDRAAVKKTIDRRQVRFLSKFGAFVRIRSRRSIKPGGKKNRVSDPGEPPRSHTGLLKRNIWFSFSPQSMSVVIGPILFRGAAGGAEALEALEYGGRVTVDERELQESGRLKGVWTRTGKKTQGTIAARPFMVPAFETEKDNISDIWKKANG